MGVFAEVVLRVCCWICVVGVLLGLCCGCDDGVVLLVCCWFCVVGVLLKCVVGVLLELCSGYVAGVVLLMRLQHTRWWVCCRSSAQAAMQWVTS